MFVWGLVKLFIGYLGLFVLGCCSWKGFVVLNVDWCLFESVVGFIVYGFFFMVESFLNVCLDGWWEDWGGCWW